MKKKRLKMTLMLVLACLALVSLTACAGGKDEIRRELVEVSRGDIVLSVTGDGNLSLPWHSELTFGTIGEIVEIKVAEGDRVTKGQVLATLDTTSMERTVTTAELAVTNAELAVRTAELTVITAEIDLQTAKNAEENVRTAEIDLGTATDNFREISYPYTYSTFALDIPTALVAIRNAERQLKEAKAGLEATPGTEEYAEALYQFGLAQENLVAARERLGHGVGMDKFLEDLLQIGDYWTIRSAQLAMEKAEISLAKAKDSFQSGLSKANVALEKTNVALGKAKVDLEKTRNDLDIAQDELKKTVIHAPFAGIIARVDAKAGDNLSAFNYATEIILEIIDPSRMELTAEVDEIDIPAVKPGQTAIITLDALPDVQLEGEVTFIFPLSREEAGVILYEVKLAFDIPKGLGVQSGMSANADIVLDKRSDVLLVPSRAVTQDSSGNEVVKVMVDEEIQERPVVTGISDIYQTEIVSGLSEGEVVVVERKGKT